MTEKAKKKPEFKKSFFVNLSFARKGQSLIEVMVAMTLLTVGFLGVVALLSQSLAINNFTANNVTAIYLASEGIEIAKNLIDHDVFMGNTHQSWSWGMCAGSLNVIAANFEAAYNTDQCSNGVDGVMPYNANDHLYYYPNTHLYGYNQNNSAQNGGTPTIFTRDIAMIPNGSDEITVSSTVFWAGLAGAPQSITLEDHFYDWYSKNVSPSP